MIKLIKLSYHWDYRDEFGGVTNIIVPEVTYKKLLTFALNNPDSPVYIAFGTNEAIDVTADDIFGDTLEISYPQAKELEAAMTLFGRPTWGDLFSWIDILAWLYPDDNDKTEHFEYILDEIDSLLKPYLYNYSLKAAVIKEYKELVALEYRGEGTELWRL